MTEKKDDLATQLAAAARSGSFSILDGRDGVREALRQAGFSYLAPRSPTPRGADPDGDPLASLTEEERKHVEADPKLRERFLARIETAESKLREENERQKFIEETWAKHDARDRADAIADRLITERAAARSSK